MKFFYLSLIPAVLAAPSVDFAERRQSGPQGIDVSHFQGTVDFAAVAANGLEFAFIKATEGTTFTDPSFSANYDDATSAGLIRGAYHFAHPDSSSGADQAQFFLAHGGGWTADGITLPGVLDIEYNPSGAECYGLSASALCNGFLVIYTTTDWWTTCTGNSDAFGNDNPLFIARYASSIGTLPAGWDFATFWQYADSGPNPGDQDVFTGDSAGLGRMATGA